MRFPSSRAMCPSAPTPPPPAACSTAAQVRSQSNSPNSPPRVKISRPPCGEGLLLFPQSPRSKEQLQHGSVVDAALGAWCMGHRRTNREGNTAQTWGKHQGAVGWAVGSLQPHPGSRPRAQVRHRSPRSEQGHPGSVLWIFFLKNNWFGFFYYLF